MCGWHVVEVYHAELGPFPDVRLSFAMAEAYRYRKAETSFFLARGRLCLVVTEVVAVLFRTFGGGSMTADHFDNVFQGSVGGTGVRVAFEKAEKNVSHVGIFFC